MHVPTVAERLATVAERLATVAERFATVAERSEICVYFIYLSIAGTGNNRASIALTSTVACCIHVVVLAT